MEKRKYEITNLFTLICSMLVSLIVAVFLSTDSYAAGNTMTDASSIKTNITYNGNITESNRTDFYEIRLDNSGCLDISIKSYVNNMYYYLYDSDGTCLMSETKVKISSNTGYSSKDYKINLTSGDYYLKVMGPDSKKVVGSYSFILYFENANETFKESQGGSNNLIEETEDIDFDKEYIGQLARNDLKDFYYFQLETEGRITLSVTSWINNPVYYIFDENGKKLDKITPGYVNKNSLTSVVNNYYDLIGGGYYLLIESNSLIYSRTGNYKFTIKFTSASSEWEEFQYDIYTDNNDMTKAPEINYDNGEHRGQVALNDSCDFYKFIVYDSSDFNLTFNAWFNYAYIEVLDENNKSVYSSRSLFLNKNTSVAYAETVLTLDKGTYYIKVKSNSTATTGNYSFDINEIRNVIDCVAYGLFDETYTGNEIYPSFDLDWKGELLIPSVDYYCCYYDNKNVGIASIEIIGLGKYNGSVWLNFNITKATQDFSFSTHNRSVSYKKVKKRKRTLKSPFEIYSKKGKVRYKKLSGSKKIKVNTKTGKITVARGTKKGKYKIKIRVSASGGRNYYSASKVVKLTVRVK